MNKKTGEFSAADIKRTSGKTPRKENIYAPYKKRAGYFVCSDCRTEKADAERGAVHGNYSWSCKACDSTAAAIVDGTWRSASGQTLAASQRSKRKDAAKKYASGKLPKWMFS